MVQGSSPFILGRFVIHSPSMLLFSQSGEVTERGPSTHHLPVFLLQLPSVGNQEVLISVYLTSYSGLLVMGNGRLLCYLNLLIQFISLIVALCCGLCWKEAMIWFSTVLSFLGRSGSIGKGMKTLINTLINTESNIICQMLSSTNVLCCQALVHGLWCYPYFTPCKPECPAISG